MRRCPRSFVLIALARPLFLWRGVSFTNSRFFCLSFFLSFFLFCSFVSFVQCTRAHTRCTADALVSFSRRDRSPYAIHEAQPDGFRYRGVLSFLSIDCYQWPELESSGGRGGRALSACTVLLGFPRVYTAFGGGRRRASACCAAHVVHSH
jgi:hypothetical protein